MKAKINFEQILQNALTVFPEVQRTLICSPLISKTSPSIQATSESSTQTWVPTIRLAEAAAYNPKFMPNQATRVKLIKTPENGKVNFGPN